MQTSSDAVRLDVSAATGRYTVEIASGALDRLLTEPSQDRVWIVDAFVRDRVVAAGVDPIVIVADEGAKSLDRMTDLIVALRDRRAVRGTTIVAVGGGVVQDAAAFVASIYMRGVKWVYVPTTLLSMTDSCIGGKSSINVGSYKNIVGTFHPPERVLVDPALAASLSPEQIAAGLCEAAKICLCRGPETIDDYLAFAPRPDSGVDDLAGVIALSLQAKKWFIEVDEFDRAERLILNFGHTFGHALEAASGFAVSHGISVGLGMLAAMEMGLCGPATPRVESFRRHIASLAATVGGLADTLAMVDPAAVMTAFEADKKHGRDFFAVILPDVTGKVERRLLPRTPKTQAEIRGAISAMLTQPWLADTAAV